MSVNVRAVSSLKLYGKAPITSPKLLRKCAHREKESRPVSGDPLYCPARSDKEK